MLCLRFSFYILLYFVLLPFYFFSIFMFVIILSKIQFFHVLLPHFPHFSDFSAPSIARPVFTGHRGANSPNPLPPKHGLNNIDVRGGLRPHICSLHTIQTLKNRLLAHPLVSLENGLLSPLPPQLAVSRSLCLPLRLTLCKKHGVFVSEKFLN